MIDGYFGYYAMHEGRLMAYKRMILGEAEASLNLGLLQRAQEAREQRDKERASLGAYRWMYSGASRIESNAGVLDISGPLSRHGECNYGYEDMAGFIRGAADNPSIKKIGLKMDTPGGAVDGVVMVAEAIKYARQQRKHVSVWGGFIASAGYFIASGANSIYMDQGKVSSIGSIGVLMVHVDETAKHEKDGRKITILRADGSDQKARFNSVEPLSEEVIMKEQKHLNELRGEFLGYVRRGRSGKLKSREWENADMFTAAQAVPMGLADGVMSLPEWIEFLNN